MQTFSFANLFNICKIWISIINEKIGLLELFCQCLSKVLMWRHRSIQNRNFLFFCYWAGEKCCTDSNSNEAIDTSLGYAWTARCSTELAQSQISVTSRVPVQNSWTVWSSQVITCYSVKFWPKRKAFWSGFELTQFSHLTVQEQTNEA